MARSKNPVFRSVWCRGPAVPWSSLSGVERLSIAFRKSGEQEGSGIFESISEQFGECGIQLVEIDMSDPNDIFPWECPTCGTDVNWDWDNFKKAYPEFISQLDE